MLNNSLYQQFSNDLMDLYCKIKHPAIKSCILRFAVVSIDSFIEWLNKKPVSIEGIKNQNVYNALRFLAKLRKSTPFGHKLEHSYIVSNILFDNTNLVSSLTTFDNLLGDVRVSNILSPFSDLISTIRQSIPYKTKPSDKEQLQQNEEVLNDLLSIYKTYHSSYDISPELKIKKPSTYTLRSNMMHYLLQRFSGEIANACMVSGLDDLASKFRGGILYKPPQSGIGTIMNLKPLSIRQIEVAKKIVDRPWKFSDMKWANYNYDYIDLVFLNNAGALSNEDFYAIQKEHGEKRDPKLYLSEPDGEQYPGIEKGEKVNIDSRLNVEYLSMLSIFFVEFQSKLKIPTEF